MSHEKVQKHSLFLSLLTSLFVIALIINAMIFGVLNFRLNFSSLPQLSPAYLHFPNFCINAKLGSLFLFSGMIVASYNANKHIFLEIIKDLRWLRLTHYFLMLILGVVIATKSSGITASFTLIINLLLAMVSVMLAAVFCIVTNNMIDQEIDRVSNQLRPLITGSIPIKIYQAIGTAASLLALGFASAISLDALLIISTIMLTYSLYSLPPLRLKRIPVLSKLIISSNSLAVIALGYLLAQHNLQNFPLVLVPLFLIGFTLSINFIDMKDIKGDSTAGIVTLPVLLGHKKAALIIGVAFFLTYLSFYFLVKNIVILPFLISIGVLQFFCINKKNYDERWVFLIYISSMISLVLWLKWVA